MPRQLRIDYPGAVQHVMNRGWTGAGTFFWTMLTGTNFIKTLAACVAQPPPRHRLRRSILQNAFRLAGLIRVLPCNPRLKIVV
jgi:hypothetical protein